MARKLGRWFVGSALAGLVSCGGSNVTYYKVAEAAPGGMSGSNCPTNGNVIQTFTGIDGNGEVAIWVQPGNSYLLDMGGSGLVGTLTSGSYTFTGVDATDNHGNPDVQMTTITTVSLTPSGSGMTGTVTTEQKCSGGANSCNGAQAGSSFDCTQSASVVAVQIANPTVVAPVGTTMPAGPGGA